LRNIVALVFAVLLSSTAFSVPLDPWPTWNTNFPFIARQVPPMALVARGIGTNAYYVIEVDPSTGAIPVSATVNVSINYAAATGGALPSQAAYLGGTDPGGVFRGIKTDTNGDLQVDVLSSALPTGAATSALQTTGNTSLGVIDTSTAAINAKLGSLGQKAMAGSAPVVLASDQAAIPVTISSAALPTGAATSALQTTGNTSLGTIDTSTAAINTKTPTVAQKTMANSSPVVIASDQSAIPASQSGTWNINNISGTISIPTGAATSALQTTGNTSIASIDTKTPTVAQKTMANSSPVVIASDQSAIPVTNVSLVINRANYAYSSGNVTTAAYTTLVASTSGIINTITVFESSGQGMILATGAAASEVDLLLIPPGGFDGPVQVRIASGVRLSIKAILATATTGNLIANFTGP